MKVYRLYGLLIESAIDLHLPVVVGEPADLKIKIDAPMSRIGNNHLHSDHFDTHYQRLFWPFAGSAEILNGRDITLTPFDDVDPSIFSFAVLGPVIAIILHYRKFLTLHASCAGVYGKAVAFMGDKGAGKSTMMAAILASGHHLVADDIAAIKRHEDRDMCRQGYPLMKVSDASMNAFPTLVAEPGQLIPATVGDKNLVRVPQLSEDDLPMTGLFVLKRGGEPAVRRMGIEEAYASLMRFSYPIRFGTSILKTEGSKEYISYAAHIASQLPLYELTVADGFHRYGEVVSLVEQAVVNGY